MFTTGKRLSAVAALVLAGAHCIAAASMTYVVHGYGSSAAFVEPMTRSLRAAGIPAKSFGYNSLGADLRDCGDRLYETVRRHQPDTVHFVTQSMGALVVRSMYTRARVDMSFPRIGRIVMVAPPNKGSQLADFFSQVPLLNRLLGPNIHHLRTDSASLANRLPALGGIDIGIIRGGTFGAAGYNPFIAGDNDGFLSSDRTVLGTEKAITVVREMHVFMEINRFVQRRAALFIRLGTFEEP